VQDAGIIHTKQDFQLILLIIFHPSVDLAWSLLMEDCFVDLRNTIYKTESERKRFRQVNEAGSICRSHNTLLQIAYIAFSLLQLIVNVVLATDIVDKDLKALRNARWEKAFQAKVLPDEDALQEDVNRKATIILEHLIQVSGW
jgi:hypothetical protein